MITFGELRSRILRLLGDPEGAGYSNSLITDAIGAAFEAILPWTPKPMVVSITGDGNINTFALPSDLYEIEAIVSSVGEVLPKAFFQPGQTIGSRSENSNDWYEYPSGSITFSKVLGSGEVCTLYYLAHWVMPTDPLSTGDDIEPPMQSITGITLYAAAYSLLPAAVGAAEVRQFNTRVDSGTPEQNPLQKTALYLFDLFQREMSRHPKRQRAVK